MPSGVIWQAVLRRWQERGSFDAFLEKRVFYKPTGEITGKPCSKRPNHILDRGINELHMVLTSIKYKYRPVRQISKMRIMQYFGKITAKGYD